MMKASNKIEIDSTRYTKERFREIVTDLCMTLTELGYDVWFRYDDVGVYVIEFNWNAYQGMGTPILAWVDPDDEKVVREEIDDDL